MIALFNNLPLSRKILLVFAIFGAFLVALGVDGVVTTRTMTDIGNRHVVRGVAGALEVSNISDRLREARIIVYSHATSRTDAEARTNADRYVENRKQIAAAIDRYAPIGGADFAADVETLRQAADALAVVDGKAIAMGRQNQSAELELVKNEGKAASQVARDSSDRLFGMTKARSQAAQKAGDAYSASATLTAYVLAATALAGLLGGWLLLHRTLATPMAELAAATLTIAAGNDAVVPHKGRGDELGKLAEAVETFRAAADERERTDALTARAQAEVTRAIGVGLNELAAGNLTTAIDAEFTGSFAGLKGDFNEAVARLRELVSGVSAAAEGIRTGSDEIAQASEDLARRTEGNAASLEETSAALVQIEGRLKSTADAAQNTVSRANRAIGSVGSGRSTAETAMSAMGRVSGSAKGIDSVIEGLDKIAFQTRVLAMNAAVEAGRAGDAGRGFAVVADLVSALAMRAEEEAKRARDQLTVTQSEIVIAVEAVERVDQSFTSISEEVNAVHELVANIAADNVEQSAAVSEITATVGNMDRATQQNAAMVEETSAAAQNLASEVAGLSAQAALFRTGAGPARQHPGRSAAAPAAPKPIRLRSEPAATPAYTARPVANGHTSAAADWADF